MKRKDMVLVTFDQKSPDSFLSFRCKLQMKHVGQIMAYIATLPDNEKKMLKAKSPKV